MILPIPFQIETERLTLRNYTPEDAGMLLKISRRNLQHWQEFESENILYALADPAAAVRAAGVMVEEWQAGRNYFIGIFIKGSGEFAGQIYLGPREKTGELEAGYVADLEHEGKGYITEALTAVLELVFTRVGVEKVWIHCSDHNPRSASVAQRCGFILLEHHAVSRHNPAHGGELVFLLARENWQKQHQPFQI